jgi:hypothetical protein
MSSALPTTSAISSLIMLTWSLAAAAAAQLLQCCSVSFRLLASKMSFNAGISP